MSHIPLHKLPLYSSYIKCASHIPFRLEATYPANDPPDTPDLQKYRDNYISDNNWPTECN